MNTSQKALNSIIAGSVTPVLKTGGFRKQGMNFYRRNNEVVQVINIQSSQGSSHEEVLFYINVALAFDEVCRLSRVDILEKPKIQECDTRGTRDRLENLIDGKPDSWKVNTLGSATSLSEDLRGATETLLLELDQINSITAYSEHQWFNRFRPKRENAQIFYILENLDAARKEVEQLCELFADRKSANEPQWWFEKLGLEKLRLA